jgi:uncharacterized protein
MTSDSLQRVTITVNDGQRLSGLLVAPPRAHACYVIAHGAGAGMEHPFMGWVAEGLAERGVATLRYQFPYMQRGSKRPDVPKVAHAAVRAAVATMAHLAPDLSLIAGGKSYGGRMTSQAHAASPLPGVRGLAFLGFPSIPLDGLLRSVVRICLRYACRCSSCKGAAIGLRTCRFSNHSL